MEFSSYFGVQDELIALNETAVKYGGKLIWSWGQETLGVIASLKYHMSKYLLVRKKRNMYNILSSVAVNSPVLQSILQSH